MPLTLRLVYHGFRATVRAGLLFLLAWVFLIPASASDNTVLGAPHGTTYPTGLRMMRTAKIVVAVAPDRAYDLIAIGLDRPGVTPLMVKIGMIQIAAGNVGPVVESDRDIAGPRFIQVD